MVRQRVKAAREPAADLARVCVPGQRLRERDGYVQRLGDVAGTQEALVGDAEVAALGGEPLE